VRSSVLPPKYIFTQTLGSDFGIWSKYTVTPSAADAVMVIIEPQYLLRSDEASCYEP
jgi:hypothetical protein